MENSELVDVDERAYGAFFGGDSYVIKYTYTKNNKSSHIIPMLPDAGDCSTDTGRESQPSRYDTSCDR